MSTSLLRRPSFLGPVGMHDPFALFDEEMKSWLSRAEENGFPSPRTVPSLDVSESESTLEVKMDAPGVDPKDIDVQVNGQLLTISGSRKSEKEEKGKTFHRLERRFGSFSRSVTLPCAISEKGITAEIEGGVLTVTLPKSEASKSKKIVVKPR